MSITPEDTRRGTLPVDFVNVGSLLSQEEKEIRVRVRSFVDEHVIPAAASYWDRAEFPFDLLPGLGELGIMGGTFGEEYGCAGWNNVAYGLAIAELARGSGSLSTFLHVQSGLAMTAIHELGTEEQKHKWLPPMARCEKVGCFGLTEPEAGSDPGSLGTTAVSRDGGYVLNGEKRWIGNASFADVVVIWARTEDGRISSFLVEGDNLGYHAEVLPRKGSQRAAWQTHIKLEDCRIPAENRLPKAQGLGSTLSILTHSRYGVGWDGLGQATDCYETALAYAKEREQFGQPIAATARDVLGGNGVLLDYRVMEHMADIEGVYSYEGTNDVNTLIVGQAITGHRAFDPRPPKSGG